MFYNIYHNLFYRTLVFVEASILLFPMVELIGEARLGNVPHSGSWRRLANGIDWLIDPSVFSSRSSGTRKAFSTNNDRVNTLGNYMSSLPSGPKVKELYHLWNYFIHGLKNQDDPNFDIGAVQTSMNYELPYAITKQSKAGLITLGVTQFTFLEAESKATWLDYANLSGLKPASRKVFKPNCVSPIPIGIS